MAEVDFEAIRGDGRDAALAGGRRSSPYDGRTQAAREWLRGYDSVVKEQIEMTEPTDAPSTTESTAETKAIATPAPAAPRSSPGESTDPDVQFQIANRRGHEMVLEDETSTEEGRAHAQQAIAAIDEELKRLGYR